MPNSHQDNPSMAQYGPNIHLTRHAIAMVVFGSASVSRKRDQRKSYPEMVAEINHTLCFVNFQRPERTFSWNSRTAQVANPGPTNHPERSAWKKWMGWAGGQHQNLRASTRALFNMLSSLLLRLCLYCVLHNTLKIHKCVFNSIIHFFSFRAPLINLVRFNLCLTDEKAEKESGARTQRMEKTDGVGWVDNIQTCARRRARFSMCFRLCCAVCVCTAFYTIR